MTELGVKFIGKTVTRSTGTTASGVAALIHEVFDYAMEGSTIIKTLASKKNKVVDRLRNFIGMQTDFNIAFISMKHRCIRFLWINDHRGRGGPLCTLWGHVCSYIKLF